EDQAEDRGDERPPRQQRADPEQQARGALPGAVMDDGCVGGGHGALLVAGVRSDRWVRLPAEERGCAWRIALRDGAGRARSDLGLTSRPPRRGRLGLRSVSGTMAAWRRS